MSESGIRQMIAKPQLGNARLGLRAGEVVEVRSRDEILRTLDHHGAFDALPFMPEMLKWSGQRFRVIARADKTCDTIEKSGGRRMIDTVHLEGLRCDGIAHGGCQAGCLVFWKEAWLKRVTSLSEAPASREPETARPAQWRAGEGPACNEEALATATRVRGDQASPDGERFACQATALRAATTPLAWWDVRQYVRDVRSGNVAIAEVLKYIGVRTILNLIEHLHGLPGGYRVAMALARSVQRAWWSPGPEGHLTKTPVGDLNLKPGDRVMVKSKEEIFATLDKRNRNRGLFFDAEMQLYCGREFTVSRRVERIINEKTGKMMTLPNDCIVLEGVVCPARVSAQRLFCPRRIYSYWREIWLRRV
jgi:hypothetical protein